MSSLTKSRLINAGILLGLVLLLAGAFAFYQNYMEGKGQEPVASQTPQSQTQGEMAADFAMEDGQGKQVRLADFVGDKPLVINFWASWCGYCVQEMPHFQEVYEEYGDQVEFLMVDMTDGRRETKETAKEFLQENNLTLPVYFDTEGQAKTAYKIFGLPQTCILNREGKVVETIQGYCDKTTLVESIKKAS
ncbi:MAG: TlpA family protein disulfide reductase [Eubacterium sp.]|nr:TlpA family protein disulfide reductase [Eubacterium sp.]